MIKMVWRNKDEDNIWDKHSHRGESSNFNFRDMNHLVLFKDSELNKLEFGDKPLIRWIHSIDEEAKRKKKKLVVLDAGCGTGFFALYMAKLGHKSYGLDFSKESLEIAKKLVDKNKLHVDFRLGDVRKLPYKDKFFDLIISSGVIEHFPDTSSALREYDRVLKKDGKFIGNVPNRYSIFVISKLFLKLIRKWDVGYEKSFSQNKLKKLLNASHFRIIRFVRMPIAVGKRCPIYGKILRSIEKPFFSYIGGMHTYFFTEHT